MKRAFQLLVVVVAVLPFSVINSHTRNSARLQAHFDGNNPAPPWFDGTRPLPPYHDGTRPLPPYHDGTRPLPPYLNGSSLAPSGSRS